jgi:type I restriction enzyme R subunit
MSERGIVEELLRSLEGLGWRESAECPKVVREDFIINGIFDASFKRLNDKVLASEGLEDRIDSVLSKVKEVLRRAEPHEFLEYLKSGLFVEEGRKRVKVILVNYENIDGNVFTMCREVTFHGERFDERPDIILYVNGIPLIIIEVENPFRLGERALEEGVSQLLRYEREVPQLFKYVQMGVVYTDVENSVYMPMMVYWRGKERWYGRWRDSNNNYNILDLLRRERVLDILRWFTFYKGREKKDKIIPRYNQYWATVKAVERITGYLVGRDNRNRGLIWQWQGSGKTYIMFFIAYQFIKRFFDRDPIVFFIVDRRELQRQLYDEFIKDIYAPYFQELIKIVESIDKLKSILKDIKEKEARKQAIGRGIYVILIQKFRHEELEELEPIHKREIVVLLDEAHRSLYGVLGATLNKVLPQAIKLAFTGTPVMSYERNTFIHFAYPEREELYLHKYFIRDSISDGYTLPLKYQVVQEIDHMTINVSQDEIRDLLNTWIKNVHELGSLDDLLEEEVYVTKSEIRQKLNTIKVFLENPDRLKHIANYIAGRVKEDTEDFRFKAMIVVASRLACVRMKKALDEALVNRYGDSARRWSEVVMTYTTNEREEEIREYLDELLDRWRGDGGVAVKDWDEVNRMIQDSFKEKEDPRILIVTDMLITGFDYPKLKVMYLDKPLYEHRLLQAIARVNRPYKAPDLVKEFGLIVDFIGLLDNVKKVVERYELLDRSTYKEIFEISIGMLKDAVEELEELINDIKQNLATGVVVGNYEVRLDIDEVVEGLTAKGLEVQVQVMLANAARLLAMGYMRQDLNAMDLLAKMRRACNLYRALGALEDKLKFHKYIIFIAKLHNVIMHYVRGSKLPDNFWKELLRIIHDKTVIPEIGLVSESKIGPDDLEEILRRMKIARPYEPQMVHMIAEAFLVTKGLLKIELANPVYKHIYERLKELEEEWASRGVSGSLVDRTKDLINDLLNYMRKRAAMNLAGRLIYDVKEFLHRIGLNLNISRLEVESTLNNIIGKYTSRMISKPVFFHEDKRNIETALLKDLFKMSLKDIRKASLIAEELADYIEREILRELREHH